MSAGFSAIMVLDGSVVSTDQRELHRKSERANRDAGERSTLQDVSRAARSVLAAYLERHPEALLRGQQGRRGCGPLYCVCDFDRAPRSRGRMRNLGSCPILDARPHGEFASRPGARFRNVGPVTIPASVQPQFVLQVATNGVEVDEFNR